MRKAILSLVAVLAIAGVSQAGFVAYNDLAAPTTGNAANVTNIGANQSGSLLDIATGTPFATLTVGALTGPGTGNNTQPTTGEAFTYFTGTVNLIGYLYCFSPFTNALTFSGLDVNKQYELVLTGYPGNQPTNTLGTILTGAQSFTNNTTIGTGVVISGANNESTQVLQDGSIVIKYGNIVPSAAGTMGINLFTGVATCRIGAIRLAEVPEPTTMALLAIGGLSALLRRRK